jgi:hypothetical protein
MGTTKTQRERQRANRKKNLKPRTFDIPDPVPQKIIKISAQQTYVENDQIINGELIRCGRKINGEFIKGDRAKKYLTTWKEEHIY